MLEKEMIEMAKRYKRRVAGSFVLVDADKISGKIAGSRFVATKKIDGTLQALFYENGEVTAVSTSGKITKGLPCLEEAAAHMKSYGLKSAVIEAELYAVLEDGKRERVGDVATAVVDSKLWDRLFLDLYSFCHNWPPICWRVLLKFRHFFVCRHHYPFYQFL